MCKELRNIRIYMLYNIFLDGTMDNEKGTMDNEKGTMNTSLSGNERDDIRNHIEKTKKPLR